MALVKDEGHIRDWIPNTKRGAPFGWISPEGLVYITQSLEHCEFLADIPELSAAYAEYESEVEGNNEYMHHELEYAADNDEHPAMHRFDGINDDARDRIYKSAYKRGWVRFGFTIDLPSTDFLKKKFVLSQFEVYGSPDGVDKIDKPCKKLAKELFLFYRAFRIKPPRKRSWTMVFDYDVEEANYWKTV